ncbi:MAG: hypothetical protein RL316_247 [Bacteroidota bacterium]
MPAVKPRLQFWQIINMNLGFFGIQYSFGLQQSAVNPIYDFLGARPDEIPLLNLAGPLTGLIIQPIIGALSDKTWHPVWGRRKPYFFIGALLCSLALFFYPFSSALWMAVGLLWILDIGNNTAMEPYRAFIADKLDEEQQPTGFLAQSFFTGVGQTLANLSLFIFPMIIIGRTGALPNWVFASFILGAVCSIATIWWSMRTTSEIPPTPAEIQEIKLYQQDKPHPIIQLAGVLFVVLAGPFAGWLYVRHLVDPAFMGLVILLLSIGWIVFLYVVLKHFQQLPFAKFLCSVLAPFFAIADAIRDMPIVMWQLGLVYLFQWYALFCYWQNSAKCVAENVYGWISPIKQVFSTPSAAAANNLLFEKAVSWTGLVNAWYNVVTFLVAFVLVGMAKRFGAKWVHAVCLVLVGIGLLVFSQVTNPYLLFIAITGFGIAWASMMGVPYLLVIQQIPPSKYGVYMGIINMMIVIPMFIQTTTFGAIMNRYLDNDASQAVGFAGILLLLAALMTLRIKTNNISSSYR